MKEGWKMVKLGEVCEIFGRIGFRGYTTKDLVESPSEGAISLSPSNIVDGRMDYSKCTYISWYKYNESPEIMIFNGDILLVKTGSSYGKSALVEELPHKATINPQSVVLKNFKIYNKFLAYQIRTKRIKDEFNKFVSGTAIPTFSQAKLSEVQIYCPPLEEQHRIVGILDTAFAKIDALKANAEANLKNAKALFQQVLAEELKPKEGWVEKKIGEVLKLQSGENLPAKKMKEGKYPVYGGNGISGYHNEYNMAGHNVIIGRVGALCGNVRYLSEPFWLTDNGFKVILNEDYKIDLFFLTNYLNFANLRQYAKQTAQPVISNVALKEVKFVFPPLEEQHRIVATLDALSEKCRRLEQVAQRTISECDALKQSILRQAFSGEL